ncbi:hypothetical protein BDZ89DRAFT_1125915 [Hymenopellis radicata]|nr:hypothetical protein BDZ89DRAFT_1125915 [Hymenopellis radicata]
MTTQLASSSSTTTVTTPSAWDSRNSAFISPTRLQQLRQKQPRHHFTSSPQQPPTTSSPSDSMAATEQPQRTSTGDRHGRTSSFFSFNRKQQHQQQQLESANPSHNASVAAAAIYQRHCTCEKQLRPSNPVQPPQLHPEIRSVVGLTIAHAHKVYLSGPLVRKIERSGDGQKPTKDDGWNEVWAQLGGTTLSIWDMKQIQEASSQNKEVPPTYVNVTDAFVSVLGSITVPATPTTPAQRYANVLTLNTAGSNLLLFSCPSTESLISWAAALRLCAWEKSRLEEIYTAHLIRITLSARDIPSTLVRGRMEGWARVRIAGQTDWKRVWMVVSATYEPETPMTPNSSIGATPTHGIKKKRMSALFARDASPTRVGPSKANVSMFLSQKPKDRKKVLLTMTDVTQAFAVYPERPELISKSTLIKIEGRIGTEDIAAGMRGREGWILIMPELEGGLSQAAEMLKWVVAYHDAFQLYGRPQAWTWDPREPTSLMFAYPVGPDKDLLFLDRELAETLDPREDGTSTIRSRLLNILFDRMRGVQPAASNGAAPAGGSGGPGPQLPPLSFDNMQPQNHERHLLTPITEKSSVYTHGRAMSVDAQSVLGTQRQSLHMNHSPVAEEPSNSSFLPDRSVQLTQSPDSQSPTSASRDKDIPSLPSPHSGPSNYSNSYPAEVVNKANTSQSQEPIHSPSPKRVQSPPGSGNSSLPPSSPRMEPTHSQTDLRRSNSPASVLTSPFSVATHNGSVLTSPYSTMGLDSPTAPPKSPRMQPASPRMTPKSPVSQTPKLATIPAAERAPPDEDLGNEAGALYFMQFENNDQPAPVSRRALKSPPVVHDGESEEEEDESDDVRTTNNRYSGASIPSVNSQRSAPLRQGTPMAFMSKASERDSLAGNSPVPSASDRASPISSRQGLGRKPSGARAPSSHKTSSQAPYVGPVTEEFSDQEDSMDLRTRGAVDDDDLDALAALSYLQVEDHEVPPQPAPKPLAPKHAALTPPPPPPPSSDVANQYKSSFAPSKQAAERKARAEAKEAAHHAAKDAGWNESSDEEEEEDDEEEEEDDADSDRDPSAPPTSIKPPASTDSHGPPHPRSTQGHSMQGHGDYDSQQFSHMRPPRTLPQIPGRHEYDEPAPPQPPYAQRQRVNSDVRSDARFTQYNNDGMPIRIQTEQPQQNNARNNMWSQVLEPGHQTGGPPERDTFVQLEPPSQTMTKAFTPQGLLSAGMQDKSDRSAKRQEEVARETGASLINVPHKPPPPQTGLLGAISAHERDRKREGGVGAALTEREREKRLAEERQRRFDDQQRQQMEQMQAGGSMYGGYNPMMNPMMMGMMGMNPMMTGQGLNPMMTGQGMNPMMTGNGMNPMMTGNGMNPMMSGYPGMMGGFNPQHMFAAQQAAQAYQQAMMNFSVAGSQAGGEGGNPSQQPMNPMMGGMNGFDPRMSMMGMPMMGMGGMGSPMMNPMGSPMNLNLPQGAGTFDPRFPPPGGTPSPQELLPPNVLSSPKLHASNNSSPVGRGSPLARAVDAPNTSRPTSPKP